MTDKPTVEIVSDGCAYIVKNGKRFELAGGSAPRIIENYRHCLTHDDVTAELYLWGLIDGIQHGNLKAIELQMADFRARQKREERK